jgi:hypothetical protein
MILKKDATDEILSVEFLNYIAIFKGCHPKSKGAFSHEPPKYAIGYDDCAFL